MAKPVKNAGVRRPASTKSAPQGFAKVDAIAEQAADDAAAEPASAGVAATASIPAILAAPADKAASTPVATAAAPLAQSAAPVVEAAAPVVEATATQIETVADTVSETVQQTADAVDTATETVASTAQKDVTLMATAFESPKALNDFNDRAKGALEKGGKVVADMGEFAKGNVEALVESTRIAAKGFETMGQDAAEYTRTSFEGMTANLRTLASVKSPTEFFKLQNDYMRSAFDQMVQQTSKSTEAFMKLAGDAAQPLSSRMAVAVEKVKTAA
ncbi:phasin family protein [Sphingomonas sp. RS2018]